MQTITHRCHLSPPGLFHELPVNSFDGRTLSQDPRTARLVLLAVERLSRVHTLRIIFGHPRVNEALLAGFFDSARVKHKPVRRLWLENCATTDFRHHSAFDDRLRITRGVPDASGLESVRFRRLPIAGRTDAVASYCYSRGVRTDFSLQDGAGSYYSTSANRSSEEEREMTWNVDQSEESVDTDVPELHLK